LFVVESIIRRTQIFFLQNNEHNARILALDIIYFFVFEKVLDKITTIDGRVWSGHKKGSDSNSTFVGNNHDVTYNINGPLRYIYGTILLFQFM
jgi:hypothetical protein